MERKRQTKPAVSEQEAVKEKNDWNKNKLLHKPQLLKPWKYQTGVFTATRLLIALLWLVEVDKCVTFKS